MSEYESAVLTSAGLALLNRAIAGDARLEFTRIAIGSGIYSDEQKTPTALQSMTALRIERASYNITTKSAISDTSVKLTALLTNWDQSTGEALITEGFAQNEIGLFCKEVGKDSTEILYSIAVASGQGTIMPAFTGKNPTQIKQSFVVSVNSSSDITVTIHPGYSVDDKLDDASENPVQNKVVTTEINTIKALFIPSEEGAFGVRYYDDEFQVKGKDGEWASVESGGGIAPNNVSDFKIKVGNQKLTLTWSDPADTVVEGSTLCAWKGTKLIMKEGAYPTSWKDGTQLIDNQERDKYKTSGYVVDNLTNGTTYYFQLFPYSDQKAYNSNAANQKSAVPQPYKTLTVKLDLTNSNPKTCVSVEDDLVGMTTQEIKDWFGYYPVLFKDGAEAGKLNPKNYAQFEDGSAADITTVGNDVMVAYPRRGLTITRNGKTITIKFTDDPDNADFKYYAHQRGTAQKDVFYLGAYKGYVSGNKLYSSSGKTITASQTIGTFRTYAHNRGTGYEQSGFYQLVFRQAMYLAIYQDLDSQTAVGQGYVASSHNAAVATGGTNAYGMDSEVIKASNPTYMTDQNHQVKCLGLEDFWGNIWEWIDGIYSDANRHILTGTDNFNDTGSGYTDQGQGASADIGNYMSDCQGATETGFIAKEASGSTTTYFCDYANLYASCVAYFGGGWDDAADAGAFRLDVTYAPSSSNAYIAARLMYL